MGGLALLVRWPVLGEFMTADEENWMLRSAGFYHNIFRKGDTGGAFMTTHPGATAMWLAGAGIVFQEQRLGFDIDTSNIGTFRLAAVLPITVMVAILIGITAWLAMRLMGIAPGIAGGALLALEPYFVGMSQIAHLDALLALFMLNSVLVFLCASFGVFPARWLILSGLFAGFAMATKLVPALWLFVFFGIVLLSRLPRKTAFGGHAAAQPNFLEQFGTIVSIFGFIAGVAVLTFWAVWPALWFTADLGRSFGKDVPSVITQEHVAIEESYEPTSPASFYVRTLLGRTSPFVLILSIVGIVYPLFCLPLGKGEKQGGSKVLWLFVYALGFLLLITLAAKKADRYALPALAALPVIAGWALAKIPILHLRGVKWGAVLVGVLLLAQVLLLFPHAIAYDNPLWDIRPLSQQGWGEGLEQAAAWLNARPRAEETFVASWYPSVMRIFFHGKTFSLSSRHDDRVGFVVLYRNMLGRGADDIATNVLEEFQNRKPIHTVEIQGVPYVWIYDVRGLHYFPQHVGDLFGDRTVGQLVPIEQDNWSAIEIGLATFSSRHNTQDVILHVRESIEATEDVRTVRLNANQIEDSSYHRFEFESIADAAGKTFYVFLDSPTSQPGDAITVRFANEDILPGEMVRGGAVAIGRDVAYRIPSQQLLQ